MKVKSILASLLLTIAGLQTTWAQENGSVTGGKAKVTLYKTGGQAIEYKVTELDSIVFSVAEPVLVTKIELSETSVDLPIESTKRLIATVKPSDADNPAVTWKSNDENIAQVIAGLVVAIAEGNCVITCNATDGSGVKAECQVRVYKDNSGSIGGHDYVDLGLPSGTLWATCNIGANRPEQYGEYFAWGETTAKDTYDWSNYKYCKKTYNTLTKYCTNSTLGYEGYTDDKTELELIDDAATMNWGNEWKVPSEDQFLELVSDKHNIIEKKYMNGIFGSKITSKYNGNSIFLPHGGGRYDNLIDAGIYGYYWLCSCEDWRPYRAYYMWFNSSNWGTTSNDRCCGMAVRPVRKQ